MPLSTIDNAAKKGVTSIQDYAILSGRAIGNVFRRPRYLGDMFTQADIIGVGSLPIVVLTGFFYRRRSSPPIGLVARPVRRDSDHRPTRFPFR